MKKALYLIFVYFILLVLGTLFSTLFYSLYLNVVSFTAGRPLELFRSSDLISSFFYILLCSPFFVSPFLCYYRVRHAAGALQTLAYILLLLFTWLLLFPMSVRLRDFAGRSFASATERQEKGLTGGYFRKVGDKIYYLVEDYNFDRVTRVIEFDTDGDAPPKYKVVFADEDFELLTAGKTYKDVIIKSTFDGSSVPNFINLRNLIFYGENSLRKGFGSYICFLALVLAISVIYVLSSMFDWDLLNVCSVIFTFVAVMIFNSLYFSSVFEPVKNQIYKIGFFGFANKYVENSFLVFVNLLFSLILLVVGLVKFFLAKNAGRGDEE